MIENFNASPELSWFFSRIGALRDFAIAKSKECPENTPVKVIADELLRLYKGNTVCEVDNEAV